MSTYTRRKCPVCGYELEGWHKNNEYWRDKIGKPFEECPNCKRNIRNSQYKEFIMIDKPKLFIVFYVIVDLFKSLVFGGMLGFLIAGVVLKIDSTPAIMFSAILGFVLLLILHCVSFKKAISESIERTSDLAYCEYLYNNGLISKNIFLEQKNRLLNI